MADEYKAVLTGGLSLKGGLFKNKKKKKGKRKRDESATSTSAHEGASEENLTSKSGLDDADGSGLDGKGKKDGSDVDQAGEDVEDMLTPAQRKFRQKQLKREGRTIRKMVEKTHRERVEEFNALLASMTEHNDIPRCSAAGNDELIELRFSYDANIIYMYVNNSITTGLALGVVATACILGVAGTTKILALRTLATFSQDGLFSKILTLAQPTPAPSVATLYPAPASNGRIFPPPQIADS